MSEYEWRARPLPGEREMRALREKEAKERVALRADLDRARAREAELEGQVARLREALAGLGITPCVNKHNGEGETLTLTTPQARAVTQALSSAPAIPWVSPEEQKRREDVMVEAAKKLLNSWCSHPLQWDELETIEQAMRAAVKP